MQYTKFTEILEADKKKLCSKTWKVVFYYANPECLGELLGTPTTALSHLEELFLYITVMFKPS